MIIIIGFLIVKQISPKNNMNTKEKWFLSNEVDQKANYGMSSL